jgi:hypothetical protein
MRRHEPRYIDPVMVVALVMLVASGLMAVQRYIAFEPTAESRFETVRY